MRTTLTPNEKILLSTHKSLKSFVIDFVLLLILGYALTRLNVPSKYTIIGIMIIAAYQIILLVNYKIYVTSARIITETGFFSQNLGETMIDKINQLNSSKNLIGTILGYGTVHIQTSSNEKVILEDISKVDDLKELINKARSEYWK